VDRAKLDLERRLGPSKVLTDREACAPYGQDESEVEARLPDAVVLAASTADIAATLAIAEAHGVPVTPRAGGSGRTGGAVPVAGGIVLATHTMNQVKEIHRGDMVAVVEPGLITGQLHEAVEKEGLFYPPDPNSLAYCMIGGNVAENAGGPRAFKYGVTREYVLGLEACLMGGQVLRTGRRTVKGVTGYDVTSLLVGSEGTLGVFTEITLKLVAKPPTLATILALFTDVHACGEAVTRALCSGIVPRCLELMDSPSLVALRNEGAGVDPRAGAALLVELDGSDAMVEFAMQHLGEVISAGPGVLEVQAAQDSAKRERLWAARRALSPATKRLAKHKLSEDVVVPRSKIAALLEKVEAIGTKLGVQHLTYGHAGDGNLHVNFLWNDASERPRIDQALEALMRATVELGGTLTGEHGVGVTKAAYLPIEQSSELMGLQKDIKRVFDPKGLLNPGKIFPAPGHKHC
jgi:glycolate oxidase